MATPFELQDFFQSLNHETAIVDDPPTIVQHIDPNTYTTWAEETNQTTATSYAFDGSFNHTLLLVAAAVVFRGNGSEERAQKTVHDYPMLNITQLDSGFNWTM